MPINRAALGQQTGTYSHPVDARWTMAYAASLGDTAACYLDTTRSDGVVAHPLFSICPEWPVALASRDLLRENGLTMDEQRRAVHATHDSHVLRLVRPGDVLHTQATVIGIESRRPGAFVTERFDTIDQHGELVARTYHGMLLLGVDIVGEPPAEGIAAIVPTAPEARLEPVREQAIAIEPQLAHTYSECARIWNPVHTDRAVALAAGLPDIILHGSATLALAVSSIVAHEAGEEPARISRIGGEFRGMVFLPSTLRVSVGAPQESAGALVVPFEAFNDRGEAALRHGHITLTPPSDKLRDG